MLSSITPLGERGRGNRWWLTTAAYVVGSVLGGVVIGTLVALAGRVLRVDALSTAVIAVLSVLLGASAAVFDIGRRRGLRLPSIHRQVNEDWMTQYRGWVYGLGWGFQLGLGVVTIVTTATVYLVLALAFLSATLWVGALLGAAFGLARAVPIFTAARVHTPDALLRFHRRLQDGAGAAQVATIVADVVVVGAGLLVWVTA